MPVPIRIKGPLGGPLKAQRMRLVHEEQISRKATVRHSCIEFVEERNLLEWHARAAKKKHPSILRNAQSRSRDVASRQRLAIYLEAGGAHDKDLRRQETMHQARDCLLYTSPSPRDRQK